MLNGAAKAYGRLSSGYVPRLRANSMDVLLCGAAALIGLTVFIKLYGFRILDPNSVEWLMGGDWGGSAAFAYRPGGLSLKKGSGHKCRHLPNIRLALVMATLHFLHAICFVE